MRPTKYQRIFFSTSDPPCGLKAVVLLRIDASGAHQFGIVVAAVVALSFIAVDAKPSSTVYAKWSTAVRIESAVVCRTVTRDVCAGLISGSLAS